MLRAAPSEFVEKYLEFTSVLFAMANQLSQRAPKLTSLGWTGGPKWRRAVERIKLPGDHPEVEGIVPTEEEAKGLINDAGGKIERIEAGHPPGGVSTHTDPYINYYTPKGDKATVTIQR